MLYCFLGEPIRSAQKARELIAALQKKRPEAPYRRITAEEKENTSLEELLTVQGLFYQRSLIFLDDLWSFDTSDDQRRRLRRLAQAPHVFVLRQTTFPPEFPELCARYAQAVHVFADTASPDTREQPDTTGQLFAGARAFAAKETARAWQLLTTLPETVADEQVHGAYLWALKQLRRAKAAAGNSPRNLAGFVAASRKWSEAELQEALISCLQLPTVARRRKVSLRSALEAMVLRFR